MKKEPYIPGLKRRGFTARFGKEKSQPFGDCEKQEGPQCRKNGLDGRIDSGWNGAIQTAMECLFKGLASGRRSDKRQPEKKRKNSTLSLLAGSTNFNQRCNSDESLFPRLGGLVEQQLSKGTKPCSMPFYL